MRDIILNIMIQIIIIYLLIAINHQKAVTWTKIIMNLYTPTASSRTTTLTFFTQNSSNPSLTYVYYNIAKNSDILQSHGGTGHLIFYKENQVLEGNYYTDEKRDNHGTIKLIKNS